MKKNYKGIQLACEEIFLIRLMLAQFLQPNFLVFGLGNDSPMWRQVNETGKTVFLESHQQWFDEVKKRDPHLEAFLVTYSTKITAWQKYLENPETLAMELPASVPQNKWDVVLVDAPQGQCMADVHPKKGYPIPGRMQSIYMAKKLTRSGGYIFVHDAEREVEACYCDALLLPENLVFTNELGGESGNVHLRCYRQP